MLQIASKQLNIFMLWSTVYISLTHYASNQVPEVQHIQFSA